VIANRADYDYARDVMTRYDLGTRAGAVLLSPVHGVQRADELVTWMLDDHLEARLQIQAHKYIWTPETRGV
jgi:7-carboxy-7-deazaguanine synthase